MDIYDYLKMDHEKVAHLFDLFKKSQLIERKKEIVALIMRELMVHANSEQEIFYKALSQHPQSAEDAQHGEKEHAEIESQIKRINHPSSLEKWEEEVYKLQEIVDHHVKEEESTIFKKAKQVLSEEDAFILKEQMHYLKGPFLILLDKKLNEAA